MKLLHEFKGFGGDEGGIGKVMHVPPGELFSIELCTELVLEPEEEHT